MKAFIAFAIVMGASVFGATPAQAQTTVEIVRDAVFTEVERRVIREHFGGPDAAQQPRDDGGAPEWAVKTMDDDENDDADEAEEADDDRGKPEKGQKDKGNKGNKGKGNGNAKGKSGQMPPGLAKRDQLPPGLAKQLADKGRLPPGIAKRDLPADLASKLPQRSETQEVTIVDDDVVLTDKATGVILDVLKDVVTNGADGGATNPDGTLADPGPQSGTEDNLLDTVLKSIFGGRAD